MYKGATNYRHQRDSLGILLVNLGTPAAPEAKALRPFLRNFLNDTRVIENRALWWKFLLNCIIIPLRAPKSAKAYEEIWEEDDSPLNIYSNNILEKLRSRVQQDLGIVGKNVILDLGMSYSNPTIHSAMENLRKNNITKLIILPMYPQYAGSTVASVFDAVVKELQTWRLVPDFRFIQSYHDEPAYINTLAKSIAQFRKKNGSAQKLVFSFHGVPLSSLLDGDPYHCQCYKTARLVAEKLKLKPKDYMVCFQSRFGKAKWLQPYTDKTLESFPAKGIKKVQLICPGFATDCVETLEEIQGENKEIFMEAGGKEFGYIPCLNDDAMHIKMLSDIIKRKSADIITNLGEVNKSLKRMKPVADRLVKKDFYKED